MDKDVLIQSIRDIIENYGSFKLKHNGFDSPILQRINLHEISIDKINLNNIDCVEYISGKKIEEFSLELEDFDEDILTKLLDICQSYGYQRENYFISCNHENI